MESICPFAEFRPIRSNISVRPGRSKIIIGYTAHVQVGDGSLYGMFNNPATEASSDFWVAKAGKLEQYIDLDTHNPWSQGSGSRYFVAVECEGKPEEPMTWQQIATQGKLLAWLIEEGYAIPLVIHGVKNQPGLVPHFAWMDENHHTCPQGPGLVGPRFPQYQDIVAAARQNLGQEPEEEEEDMKAHLGALKGQEGSVFVVLPYFAGKWHVTDPTSLDQIKWLDSMSKNALLGDQTVHVYPQALWNNIPDLTSLITK